MTTRPKRHLLCGTKPAHSVCEQFKGEMVNRHEFKKPAPNDCQKCRAWLTKFPTC